jgi:hypothetical protein
VPLDELRAVNRAFSSSTTGGRNHAALGDLAYVAALRVTVQPRIDRSARALRP